MLLAGFLLSCFLQLAATQQQETFSVILQPALAKEGQEVTLSLRGGPRQFTECHWSRGGQVQSSNIIVTYSPAATPQLRNGTAYSGRETVHPDCSLQIKQLRRQDMGTYFVRKTTGPIQQQGDADQQQGQVYEASVFLPVAILVAGSNQINLTITTEPRFPSPNQQVTLTPKGAPKEFSYCLWLRQTRLGRDELIQTYVPGESQQNSQQKREVITKDCSLIISDLTTSDTGNYIVQLGAPFSQQQQAEKGNVSQLYVGRVYLQVTEQSNTNPHQSGSSSLNCNGGIIALVLLGSFSWVDPLMNIFSIFFSSLASLKPRFFS